MKTLDEVLNSKKITELNSRSLTRLLKFVPNNQLDKINASRTNTDTVVIPFTKENVMKELKSDLQFGWEKAEDERSISSFLMADVVCMWDWILEDDPTKLVFLDDEDYARYTFREIAKKYNIPLE